MTSEFEVLARLVDRLAGPPLGEVWAGDDAAVLGDLVITVDPIVDGVHVDRAFMTLADAGWKVVARNVSDVAAMAATPWRGVVSIVGASPAEIDELYEGITEAATHWGLAVVGGDISSGPSLVVTLTMLGRLDGCAPVLRSGAHAEDALWVAVPGGGGLGRGVAGLRLLRAGDPEGPDQAWLKRPVPSVASGRAARAAGATAMLDVSDGLVGDLCHLADASAVGFALADVPVATGATRDDALYGGDEYALVFACPEDPRATFAAAGLPEPVQVGVCTSDVSQRTVDGAPLPPTTGWQHQL